MDEQDDDRQGRIQIGRDAATVRKARMAKREPRRSSFAKVVVTPDTAARLLSSASGATSHAENPCPLSGVTLSESHAEAYLLFLLRRKRIELRDLMRWK